MDNKEIRQFISGLTNTFGNEHRRILIEELRKQHPTLQQIFMGMVLSCINDFANSERIDDRNRASHTVCKRLVDLYSADTGEEEIKDKFIMV